MKISKNLDNAKTKKQTVERADLVYKKHGEVTGAHKATLLEAERLGKKWSMLKALLPLETTALTRDTISFTYVGPCPAASISIKFTMQDESFSSCTAVIDPTIYPKNRPRNTEKYKSVMALLRDRTQSVCNYLSSFSGNETAGDVLRRAVWKLRRAVLTADEICKLQRRYDASFSVNRTGSQTEYELDVNFRSESPSGSNEVVASFMIPDSYPFSPMEVQLDLVEGEDCNVEMIQAQIEKTAKTGYGYLARVCDVVASTMPDMQDTTPLQENQGN